MALWFTSIFGTGSFWVEKCHKGGLQNAWALYMTSTLSLHFATVLTLNYMYNAFTDNWGHLEFY